MIYDSTSIDLKIYINIITYIHITFIDAVCIYSGFSGNATFDLFTESDSVLLALFERNTAPGLGYGLI